jgi:UDP-N-acetylglucosamine 2-epimerase (non-hydrolysing)
VLTSRLASLHFAPTAQAAENLRREGISRGVTITGNTGIDAVLYIRDRLDAGKSRDDSRLSRPDGPRQSGVSNIDDGKRIVLVTAHRRESFGAGFERICRAIQRLADRGDVHVVYPVHPNPNVREVVERILGSQPNITLLQPQDYVPFVDLLRRSYIILTDSGGIQEEAPSLGKPVLVLREKTERPEAVEAGTVKLVGTDEDRIVAEAGVLLDQPDEYARRSRIHNPYGDGHASERIESALRLGSLVADC